ncbi:MAG: hypothetical protein AAF515_13415 [Pseudomonadota bacterium]
MRRSLFSFALLALACAAHADFQAVLTKGDAPGIGKMQYDLHFVSFAQNEVVASVDLGANRRAPVAFTNESGSRLWVNNKQPTTKEWELLGFDVAGGKEIARLPIGRRPGPPQQLFFWAHETQDGEYIVALGQQKNRWQVDTFRLADGERTSTLPLNKGFLEVAYLTGDRVLAHNPVGRRQVYLIDPVAGRVIWESRMRGDAKRFERSKDGDFLYLIEQEKISGMAKPPGERSKELVKGYDTKVRVLRTVDGKELGLYEVGFDLSKFHHGKDNDAAYALSRKSIVTGKSKLWRIAGDRVELVREHDQPCMPEGVVADEATGVATALCKDSVEHGPLNAEGPIQFAELSATPEGGFFGPDLDTLYIDSSSGSRVAMFRLDPLELVGVRGTGSAGLKFAQALASVGGLALAAYTGYGFLSIPPYSSTAMALSDDDRKLYVMNGSTRDVTVFDTGTFRRIALQGAGRAPLGMVRFDSAPYVFALSLDRVQAYEPSSDEPVLDLDDGSFAGANGELDRLYFSTEEGLGIYELSTLERIALTPQLKGSYQAITPGKPAYRLY